MILLGTLSRKKLINVVSFNLAWFGCAYAASANNGDLAMLVALATVFLNLLFVSQNRRVDLIKAITCFTVGFFFEYLNMRLPFFKYRLPMDIPPLWMLAFWPLMAVLFYESFRFLFQAPWYYGFSMGIIGGLGYYSAQTIGQLTFNDPMILSLAGFSVVWAIEFLVIISICKQLDSRR